MAEVEGGIHIDKQTVITYH